jgi:hypothetical protein
MKVVCPCCGVDFPIDAGLNDADARRFAALMGELPPAVARLMPAYLRLHKPLKQGLRWSRMVSLLNDLAAEIKAAQVTHGGITYAAPADLWIGCIEKVLAMPNLELPLSGNGLLRKIVAGSASKAAGLAEQKTEQENIYRHGRGSTQGPVQVMETTKPRSGPPPDWKKQALGGNSSDE